MAAEAHRSVISPVVGWTALAAGSVGALLSLGVAHGCSRHTTDTKAEVSRSPTPPVAAAPQAVQDDRLGLQRAAERALPAVVSVASTRPAGEATTPNVPCPPQ
jgi:hypothetical protein